MMLYSVAFGFGLFVVRAESKPQAAAIVAENVDGATTEHVLEEGEFTLVLQDGPAAVLDSYWA